MDLRIHRGQQIFGKGDFIGKGLFGGQSGDHRLRGGLALLQHGHVGADFDIVEDQQRVALLYRVGLAHKDFLYDPTLKVLHHLAVAFQGDHAGGHNRAGDDCKIGPGAKDTKGDQEKYIACK